MNNQTAVVALGILLCTTAVALGQFYHPVGQSARGPTIHSGPAPLTPDMKARYDQIGHLDAAAAAAMNAGDYAEAEADARQSVAFGIGSGRGQELLAASLYAQGKMQAALQIYQKIAAMGANAGRNEWPYALLLLKAGH